MTCTKVLSELYPLDCCLGKSERAAMQMRTAYGGENLIFSKKNVSHNLVSVVDL
jgi:hypothetical protein